jgi:hypothetical protein
MTKPTREREKLWEMMGIEDRRAVRYKHADAEYAFEQYLKRQQEVNELYREVLKRQQEVNELYREMVEKYMGGEHGTT